MYVNSDVEYDNQLVCKQNGGIGLQWKAEVGEGFCFRNGFVEGSLWRMTSRATRYTGTASIKRYDSNSGKMFLIPTSHWVSRRMWSPVGWQWLRCELCGLSPWLAASQHSLDRHTQTYLNPGKREFCETDNTGMNWNTSHTADNGTINSNRNFNHVLACRVAQFWCEYDVTTGYDVTK